MRQNIPHQTQWFQPTASGLVSPPSPAAVMIIPPPDLGSQGAFDSRRVAAGIEKNALEAGVNHCIVDTRPGGLDSALDLCSCLTAAGAKLSVALEAGMNAGDDIEPGRKIGPGPLKLIRWRRLDAPLKQTARALLDFARSGIWNHVEFSDHVEKNHQSDLKQFVADNPNIVHSYSPGQYDLQKMAGYRCVAPLPGRPFWRTLADWVDLFFHLAKYDAPRVMRWRVENNGASVYSLGQELSYHFVPPGSLPPGYLDEICRMIEAGGSVDPKWIRHNLKRAFLVGYVTEKGAIVGNSSLKQPRPEYVTALSDQAGLDLRRYLERGYTSVRPQYRGLGIGTRLLEGLTARAGDHKIFSLIGEDNIATQTIARRNQTRKVATFLSVITGKQMGVWVPRWMLDDEKSVEGNDRES